MEREGAGGGKEKSKVWDPELKKYDAFSRKRGTEGSSWPETPGSPLQRGRMEASGGQFPGSAVSSVNHSPGLGRFRPLLTHMVPLC